jgi:hypothetical protein
MMMMMMMLSFHFALRFGQSKAVECTVQDAFCELLAFVQRRKSWQCFCRPFSCGFNKINEKSVATGAKKKKKQKKKMMR